MSTNIHALEERLREDPDDELNWEVYGDWLLQQGDPLGELISLEQAAARSGDAALTCRAQALAAEHGVAFRHGDAAMDLTWRHGFVIAADEPSAEFPSDVEALARLLGDPRARLLAKLSLNFERWSGDEPLLEEEREDRTATIPPLARLDLRNVRTLRCAYNTAGDAFVEALVRIEVLSVTQLDLRFCRLSDAGARTLAGCDNLRGLRTLRLRANQIGPEGARALAASRVFERLELLDLRGNPLGPEGARALAASPIIRHLEVLHLNPRDIEAEGVDALAASTQLPRELARLWRGRGALRVY